MQIIVDCGATKATLCLADNGNIVELSQTNGFNPNYNSLDELRCIVSICKSFVSVDEIFFYGTGCSTQINKTNVYNVFREYYKTQVIEVHSDILASARALLGHESGLACILGTGSNACLYDGNDIVKSYNSLGYALGDEGSGFDIGKSILKAYFYNQMPESIKIEFEKNYKISRADLINNVYYQTSPSCYVASFARFASNHLEDEFVRSLCSSCFDSYIASLKSQFDINAFNSVSASGSVAYVFADLLRERFYKNGIILKTVQRDPIEGLVNYHKKGSSL